jgi:hypothetical protein
MSLPLFIYFLIPCILAGITVYFQKNTPLYLKLFPVLLIIMLLVEIAGQWVVREFGSNVTLYNFYTAFELTFFLFLLREMMQGKMVKLIILILLLLYPLFCLINIIFVQGINKWHSNSYVIGNLLIVGLSMYYFFELFKRPKAMKLIAEPAFWICSGLLFFYSCSFPFLGLVNFLTYAPDVIKRNFSTILTLLNILQFILYTIAFLCRLKFNKPHSTKIA